ncbi:hypothetical protein WEI85_40385 [Actinomycetes bacterium KLBMP 9797]
MDMLTIRRAEALFASDLPTGAAPAPAQVVSAVRAAVRRYGGTRGCVAELAHAYGDYPETAAARMRWACRVAEGLAS